MNGMTALRQPFQIVVDDPTRAMRQMVREHVGRVDDKDVQTLLHG